jgi:hypothetical protein
MFNWEGGGWNDPGNTLAYLVLLLKKDYSSCNWSSLELLIEPSFT